MKTENRRWLTVLCLLGLLLAGGYWGCRKSKAPDKSREMDPTVASVQSPDEMLLYAIDELNGLEEFNSADSLREILDRFNPNNPPKADQRIDPLLAAWPEPEMFRRIIDQLNQWIRQPPAADWKPDPMIASLPKRFQELPQVKSLGEMEFSRFDGFVVQEAVWLRDVGRSAQGDVLDELDRARNLFDWTVRNIQLEPDRLDRIPQLPRETLLFGRGTASERAWVFILLLRQLDIDAAVLAVDQGRGAGGEGRGEKKTAAKDSKDNAPARQSDEENPEKAPRPLVRRRADRGRRVPVRSLARLAGSRSPRRGVR